jgi:8-amino-7-oxononanoate synthase
MHTALYQNFLNTIKSENRLRSLPEVQGRINLDFSTNDYLNLSNHPLIKENLKLKIEATSLGATGSRLLSGNSEVFTQLEKKIASDKHQEKALYFSSGFLANFSCLKALLDRSVLKETPLVFFHKRNHNSLYQAVLSTECELIRFSSILELEIKLEEFRHDLRAKFLITETVFGMDGDLIDISEIKRLSKEHKLFCMLDEAHASGVIGPLGLGLSRTVDFEEIPILIMGTFSKALGVCGAYVASSEIIINYLINKASGFIYSTAQSPLLVHACSFAWDLAKTMDQERERILSLSLYLRSSLKKNGFVVLGDHTPIIPIVIGDEGEALQKAKELQKKGILVSAVRYPTVPKGQARLRFALCACHKKEDIDHLIKVMA